MMMKNLYIWSPGLIGAVLPLEKKNANVISNTQKNVVTQ